MHATDEHCICWDNKFIFLGVREAMQISIKESVVVFQNSILNPFIKNIDSLL